MDEERSLSIPSSESEDNVRLRGRIQRRFKRSNHGERLLTEPAHNGTKGTQVHRVMSISQLTVSQWLREQLRAPAHKSGSTFEMKYICTAQSVNQYVRVPS